MCPINAECVTQSSSECACKNGFELRSWNVKETEKCVDIDECSTLKGVCHKKAVCMNLPGGYECNCQEGYFGDGKTCFPGSCTDINCSPSQNQTCVSPRSNDCKCMEGFEMTDSFVCIDVDECQKEPCNNNTDCANKPGNFSCTCSSGYRGDGISCTLTPTVLVLNTYDGYKSPLLVDSEGRNDPNIIMSFGEKTQVLESCSVTYRNRFYVFGGHRQVRQISEVTKCELRRIGTLDFIHQSGACSTVDNREIYLCFDFTLSKQCRSAVDPLGKFTRISDSNHDHRHSRTAASPSKF